jgi:hypothetical protein
MCFVDRHKHLKEPQDSILGQPEVHVGWLWFESQFDNNGLNRQRCWRLICELEC